MKLSHRPEAGVLCYLLFPEQTADGLLIIAQTLRFPDLFYIFFRIGKQAAQIVP